MATERWVWTGDYRIPKLREYYFTRRGGRIQQCSNFCYSPHFIIREAPVLDDDEVAVSRNKIKSMLLEAEPLTWRPGSCVSTVYALNRICGWLQSLLRVQPEPVEPIDPLLKCKESIRKIVLKGGGDFYGDPIEDALVEFRNTLEKTDD